MVTHLKRGEVDFCLSSPPVEGEDIECQIVCADPILLAVPAGHRLAGRDCIALGELRDEWFIAVKKGYGTRDLVDAVCGTEGFVPQYVYEGDEPARIIALVEAGIGIAFIPGTARDSREKVKYIRVENKALVREIALLWHKSRYISRAAMEFREVVLAYFEEKSLYNNDSKAIT
jgi:DNA-binding transcriptional LysR family regulator